MICYGILHDGPHRGERFLIQKSKRIPYDGLIYEIHDQTGDGYYVIYKLASDQDLKGKQLNEIYTDESADEPVSPRGIHADYIIVDEVFNNEEIQKLTEELRKGRMLKVVKLDPDFREALADLAKATGKDAPTRER